MELPFKVIIAVALVSFVLITFYILFTGGTSGEISRAEAENIFYSACGEYKQSSCDWSVRSRENFPQFMESCRVLFDDLSGDYSCLYQRCCGETANVLCSSLCHACRGNEAAGAKKELCCARYAAECGGELCDAC